MNESPELQVVMGHLKNLSQAVSVKNIVVSTRRALIDDYFDLTSHVGLPSDGSSRAENGAQTEVDQTREIITDAMKQTIIQTINPIKVNAAGVECYWFVPHEYDGKNRLLYIHGGSWMSGSVKGWGAFMGRLATATGCAVLFAEYALMPEQPFPAGLNDCITAYHWLRNNTPNESLTFESQPNDVKPIESGIDHKIFMAGDSAGGNLALACLLSLKDQGCDLPDAALAISPCTDLTASGESMAGRKHLDPIINPEAISPLAQAYVQGVQDHAYPLVSPLFGQLSGLPPIMIQTGEAEVLLDDSRRFAQNAQRAGVDITLDTWPHMPHVFQGFAPFLPQANQAMDKIKQFFSRF